jgi:shikimate dehydrogenase
MKSEITPPRQAARERGCRVQVGADMPFEIIPACPEFFGFGIATSKKPSAVADVVN